MWEIKPRIYKTKNSATAQSDGGAHDSVLREWAWHLEGIFLTKTEIRPSRGSNLGPKRDGTRKT